MQTNFGFIEAEFPEVYAEVVLAEKHACTQPRYAVVCCRIAIERLTIWLYENDPELELPYDTNLNSLIRNYEFKQLIPQDLYIGLDIIRRSGNKGAHGEKVKAYDALAVLKHTFRYVSWVSKFYSEKNPEITSFNEQLIPTGEEDDKSKKELKKIAEEREKERIEHEKKLKELAAIEAENEQLRQELAAQKQRYTERKQKRHQQYLDKTVVPLLSTEQETRKQLIDLLLFEAGWKNLREGVDIEFEVIGMPFATNPSGKGYVDYVLWGDNGKPLALVEAKSTLHDATKGKHQAYLYADCLEKMTGQRPIIFYSNGFETFLWDDQFYPPRRVSGFYSKAELQTVIQRRGEHLDLRQFKVNREIAGRPYQLQAIQAIAETCTGEYQNRIVGRHRKALLVMATGSGKTRTAAAIVDMLTRCNWVKRVLFLADRNALVSQAKDSFKEHLPQLSSIDLTKDKEDDTARLVFSTYPTMMNLIDSISAGGEKRFGINHFDLIIIDEAHRSVYQKYQAIFEYFDSLLIGLTATPVKFVDRNTYSLFDIEEDNPTFAYELNQAVSDGYLVPPKAIKVPLKFPREGIKYNELSDADKKHYEELFGIATASSETSSELDISKEKINRFLFNNDTVDKVLNLIMERGLRVQSGDKIGKTIIFAKNHRHAKFIADRFYKNYPEYGGGFLEVIDNYNDKAEDLLKRFCFDKGDEKDPQIAVSVDMMDTGVDAPRVLNLVFFKEVKSYAKFWQMIGRGTRLCPQIFGVGSEKENDKQFFLIFDICGNFEFFDEFPDGHAGVVTRSLSEFLFKAQLEVVSLIHSNPEATQEERDFAHDYTEQLYKKVKALDETRFIVRKHWEYVKKYNIREEWNELNQNKLVEMNLYLGKLIPTNEDVDELAKKFDLLIYRLELALLTQHSSISKQIDKIVDIGGRLLKHKNIPSVKRKEEELIKTQSIAFWESISLKRLEKLRIELRDLMQFLQNEKESPIFSRFEDTLNLQDVKETLILDNHSHLENYRMRIENFIQKNKNHLVIDKIYRNIPITKDELILLEDFLTHEKFNLSEIEKEFQTKSLGVFVRKILGLDIQAAQKHFAAFIQEENLNNNQIQFINLLVNYLNRNGVIDRAMLTQSPFTSINDNGLFGVFEDSGKAMKVIQLIDKLENGLLGA
ncbi:MAG: DEAD/DEAH box helicase family protein [Crocinitomicaceae bacterium]|nr:DEAD/DEAH box helicase family protein [Crocinitomicaceae bacterium]